LSLPVNQLFGYLSDYSVEGFHMGETMDQISAILRVPPTGALMPLFALMPENKPPFVFGGLGGRFVVLSFMGDNPAHCAALADAFAPWYQMFNISTKYFVGLCGSDDARIAVQHLEADDQTLFLTDPSNAVRKLYNLPETGIFTLVLDPALRLLHFVHTQNVDVHARDVMEFTARLMRREPIGLAASTAPVLILNNVFDTDLVATLKSEYDRVGGVLSGYMRTTADGKTAETTDYSHKVRRDVLIEDEALRTRCRNAIQTSIVPAIFRAFQFQVTRMERYLIGCYDSQSGDIPGGHFNRHRDNTTRGTAHRRFAVSIGLNAEDYDGGDLRFPEFDQRSYRPPTGGAVIFSCSLLHEVQGIKRGRRMAFLPFLFDEAAEKIRQDNLQYLTKQEAA
jgi:predicted 2-oxoglutarate/Fe(II)-dependent dioxygenase YbiX